MRETIIAEARRWIGTPYRHQGADRGVGCDCLGLVRGVWRAVYGRDPEVPPAYSADWAETTGEETLIEAAARHMSAVPPSEMAPGDLLVFRWRPHLPAKHVGILVAPTGSFTPTTPPARLRRAILPPPGAPALPRCSRFRRW